MVLVVELEPIVAVVDVKKHDQKAEVETESRTEVKEANKMELPIWFGVTQYEQLLATIIAVASIRLMGQFIRTLPSLIDMPIKGYFTKIKNWYKNRKESALYN